MESPESLAHDRPLIGWGALGVIPPLCTRFLYFNSLSQMVRRINWQNEQESALKIHDVISFYCFGSWCWPRCAHSPWTYVKLIPRKFVDKNPAR